jgi:anaerobic selenocysteine-containing dehydrogenase
LADLWWDDYEDMFDDILAPSGINYSELTERGILRGPTRYYKYKDKGFKTPTGRVELLLSKAEKTGLNPWPIWNGPPEPENKNFPLLLTGHKSRNYFCSDHRYLQAMRDREPEPLVEIHPDTAAEAKVVDGDEVFVETKAGRIRVKARLTKGIRPGVLSVVHGWWRPETGPENPGSWDEVTLNVLTSDEVLNRALGTPNLRALPARIYKA